MNKPYLSKTQNICLILESILLIILGFIVINYYLNSDYKKLDNKDKEVINCIKILDNINLDKLDLKIIDDNTLSTMVLNTIDDKLLIDYRISSGDFNKRIKNYIEINKDININNLTTSGVYDIKLDKDILIINKDLDNVIKNYKVYDAKKSRRKLIVKVKNKESKHKYETIFTKKDNWYKLVEYKLIK